MTTFNAAAFDTILQGTVELKDYIDTPYIVSGGESFDDEDSLREYLQERIGEAEVTYYAAAMRFLMEYDNSLHESLALASEMGFTLEKLSSELLATLLLQQKLSEELSGLDLAPCFIESEATDAA
jgi:hypothetical protein